MSGPQLVRRARLAFDPTRRAHALLLPESVLFLTPTAAAVLALCDGARSLADIVATLSAKHPGAPVARDVPVLLARLGARGVLENLPTDLPTPRGDEAPAPVRASNAVDPPIALLAELTYRCPLRCGYCSNPTDLARYRDELATDDWLRVIRESAAIGALQLHLSGGEPLLRDDLAVLVRAARDAGMYTNLITSAYGLTDARLDELVAAGLDHVQISLQDTDAPRADAIAGTTVHAHKLWAARAVKARGLALSINVVVHRGNVERAGEIVALADSLGAERLEFANAQYHGWALANRAALLPTREALERSRDAVEHARKSTAGRMSVLYVLPDYYTDAPKPCMDGWGRRFVTVIPDGTVYPCPGAHSLPLAFPNVRASSMRAAWFESDAFAAYRGTGWMPEPCVSCDRREIDHGGCRCQAFALTGDARATDPACVKSPHHARVLEAREASAREAPPVLFRVRTRKGAEPA